MSKQLRTITVLERDKAEGSNSAWEKREVGVGNIASVFRPNSTDMKFIFLPQWIDNENLREQLEKGYDVPPFFWRSIKGVKGEATGCCGSRQISDDKSVTWFRLFFKQINDLDSDEPYLWHYISFFTHWAKGERNVILCFGLSSEMIDQVHQSLKERLIQEGVPYLAHEFIVEQVPKWFDAQFWNLRDRVRALERGRKQLSAPRGHEENLPENVDIVHEQIHELSRHLAHAVEYYAVAIEVLWHVVSDHKSVLEELKSSYNGTSQTIVGTQNDLTLRESVNIQRRLQEHLLVIKCLRGRTQALESRLQHEISLRENILDRELKSDSAAMRTIALVTLLFLPGTFISTIFSTSFFNYHPDGDNSQVSSAFWLYWAWTIPITVVALSIGWSWFRRSKRLPIIPIWLTIIVRKIWKDKPAITVAANNSDSTNGKNGVVANVSTSGTMQDSTTLLSKDNDAPVLVPAEENQRLAGSVADVPLSELSPANSSSQRPSLLSKLSTRNTRKADVSPA